MRFSEYRERKQHGSEAFPMQYYFVDATHPQYVMPLHWHEEFELIRVRSGRLELYLNNARFFGEEGDLFFVAPGTLHRAEPIDCRYECIVFDSRLIYGGGESRVGDYIRPILSGESRVGDYIRPILSGEYEVDAVCSAMDSSVNALFLTLAAEEPYYELHALSLLQMIFYRLFSTDAVKEVKKKNKAFLHRRAQMILLIDKIEKEFTGRLSISDLAAFCELDPKYFFQVFREFTGKTPVDYINSRRVERACYEMTVNRRNVTEAAYESGFNELSYFSRIFKRYKGISPKQYRAEFMK